MAYSKNFKNKSDALKDYKRLSSMIEEASIPHCLLLYGEEKFLIDSLYRDLLDCLLNNEAHFSVDKYVIDFDNKGLKVDWSDLLQNVSMPSLFGLEANKVFIIKNSKVFLSSPCDADTKLIKKMINLLNSNKDAKGTYVIFIEEKVDARSNLLKYIKEYELNFHLQKLSSYELEHWIDQKVKVANFSLELELLQYLIEACEAELFLIESELKKLFIIAKKNKWQTLTLSKCKNILKPNLTGDVFALVDAISKSNLKLVLDIYNNLIDRKESNQMILLMVSRHFRELFCILDCASCNENELLNILGYSANMSWKIRKLKSQSSNFTINKLKYLIKMCADVDLHIKSNGYNESNEMLILLSLAAS